MTDTADPVTPPLMAAAQSIDNRLSEYKWTARITLLGFILTICGGLFLLLRIASSAFATADSAGLTQELINSRDIALLSINTRDLANAIDDVANATPTGQSAAIERLTKAWNEFAMGEAARRDAATSNETSTWASINKLIRLLQDAKASGQGPVEILSVALRVTITLMTLVLARVLWSVYRFALESHAHMADRLESLTLVAGNVTAEKLLQEKLAREYPGHREKLHEDLAVVEK